MSVTSSSSKKEEYTPGLEEFDGICRMDITYCKQISREEYEEQAESETKKALLMSVTSSSSKKEEYTPGLEEFDGICRMDITYCKQISREEYEEQAESETKKALLQLTTKLNQHPHLFRSVLLKRKKKEMENAGFMSHLKMKMLKIFHRSKCQAFKVTDEEVNSKLKDLTNGMQKTFDCAKVKCRHSKRLAARRNKKTSVTEKRSLPQAPIILPPVPGSFKTPKRKIAPLKNRNIEVDTPLSMRARRKMKRVGSASSFPSLSTLGSLSSLHVELMSANHLRQIRSAYNLRSPEGTTISRHKTCPGSSSSVTELL